MWRRPHGGRLRRVLSLAWPVAASNLLQSLTLFADVFMVAFLGPVALAGVGLAAQVFFLLAALGTGLATGVGALAARAVGAGDRVGLGRVVTTAVLLALGIGIPLGALGFALAGPLMAILGAEAEVARLGETYLRLLFLSMPAELLTVLATGILHAQGRTRAGLYVNLLANGVNLGLDYLLIFGNFGFPRLGVTGAALATSLSYLAGAAAAYVLLRRTVTSAPGARLWDGDLARRMLRVGAPSATESLLLNLGFMLYTLLILEFGAAALAAHQVGLRVQAFAFMPGLGFGAAAAALVGQSLGARREDEAEELGWYSIGLGLTVMVGLSVPLFILAHPIASVIGHNDPETVALSVTWIHLIAVAIPAIAVHFGAAGALKGAGETRWPLLASFVGLFAVRLPVAYVLAVPLGMGMLGIWIAYIGEYYVRALLTALRFRRGAWKTLRI